MNRLLITFSILGVVAAIAATHAKPVDSPAIQEVKADPNSEFEGEFVMFFHDADKTRNGTFLTDVKLVEIGNRLMIVGTGADNKSETNKLIGYRVRFPWQSVSDCYSMTQKQFEDKYNIDKAEDDKVEDDKVEDDKVEDDKVDKA